MEESFDQKVIRNVQNKFAVYKTTEVIGIKSSIPNLEWVESDDVDKFFSFASNLGARVIYITEADEEDEDGNSKNAIVQVGFIYQGIMHHINLLDEDDEEESEENEYEYEESDEESDEEDESEDEQVLYDKQSESQNSKPKQEQNNSYHQSQQDFGSNNYNNNQNSQENQPPQQSPKQQPQNNNNNNNNNNQGSDFIGNF